MKKQLNKKLVLNRQTMHRLDLVHGGSTTKDIDTNPKLQPLPLLDRLRFIGDVPPTTY